MNIGFHSDGQPSGASDGAVAMAADGSSVVWNYGPRMFQSAGGTTWVASTGAPAGASVPSGRVVPRKFYAFANPGLLCRH